MILITYNDHCLKNKAYCMGTMTFFSIAMTSDTPTMPLVFRIMLFASRKFVILFNGCRYTYAI
jgi:hypothetical protein